MLVDVVVRTRKVGHFFPGGTVDAFDVWLELQAVDDKGQTIFWSGKVEDDGKGPVEPGAHFYKSLQIDAHGNPINKRNAWASRATVYVRLDSAGRRGHGALPDCTCRKMRASTSRCTSKLNYRKFQWWNTQFAFGGRAGCDATRRARRDAGLRRPQVGTLTATFRHVSSNRKSIPDLPIVTVAEDTKTPARSADIRRRHQRPKVVLGKRRLDTLERLRNRIVSARRSEGGGAGVHENHANGPAESRTAGRTWDACACRKETRKARGSVLLKALALKPGLARANFFYARVLKEEGKYDEAAQGIASRAGAISARPRGSR